MRDSFSPDGLRRIRRLARTVRLMCLLGAVFVASLPFVYWAQPDWVADVASRKWDLQTLQLGWAARLGGLAATLLPVAVGVYTLWQMWSLFGCFADGELLAQRPARHLRRLGGGLCTLAAVLPLSETLTILALTLGNPPGQRQVTFYLSSNHYLALLFGLLLLALAQVLSEAARVADENAEFI